MEDRVILAVVQAAAETQRRLNQLTSTWPGAPVDVHRLQETVSRACTVLQSSLKSTSGTFLGSRDLNADSYRRPIQERLLDHLAVARRLLDDLTDIMYVC